MSQPVEPLGLKAGKAKERKGRITRGLPPGDPRHGRYTTYVNWGCRCDLCKAANTEAGRAFREGRSKTVGEEPRPIPEPVNEPMPEPDPLTYEPF
jgi:hypothetical protein